MKRRDIITEIEQQLKIAGDVRKLEDLKNLNDDELAELYEHIFLKEPGDKTGGME